MAKPRKEQISLADTPYYHLSSRCVRRALLCGQDSVTGRDYEHRRQWLVDRIRLLSSIFTVDIAAYAVMSNHYHLVVKLEPEQAKDWSAAEVISRWHCIYKGSKLAKRYLAGEELNSHEQEEVNQLVAKWHASLTDVSRFMKCLNEPIARRANKEDNCRGHFWESRFKSQALTREDALLSCMAYVDLNPVRAAIADTPETSDYTSLQERITPRFCLNAAIENQLAGEDIEAFTLQLKPLLPFGTIVKDVVGIPCRYEDYLALVDWTGRMKRDDKPGHIPTSAAPILERIGLSESRWLYQAHNFERYHRHQARLTRITP